MRSLKINLVKNFGSEYAAKTAYIGDGKLACDATFRKGKLLDISSPTAIKGLGPCVGITLFSPKRKFSAHSAAEFELPQFLSKPMEKVIKNLRGDLKRSYEEIVAFIIGGIQATKENKLSQNSSALVDAYYEELKKHNIPTTVIAGQLGDGINTRLNTYFTTGHIIVNGKPISDLALSEKSGLNEIKNALEKKFDFVEISPSLPVRFLEKEPIFFK